MNESMNAVPLTRSDLVCTLQSVRFLLVNNHCISDPIAGVTQSLRTIVEWLAEAGHECQVLTTARFESAVTFTIEEHLLQQGVPRGRSPPHLPADRRSSKAARQASRPVVRYAVKQRARHAAPHAPQRRAAARSRGGRAIPRALRAASSTRFAPDVLIAANGHAMIFEAMRAARRRGITTAFAVRGYGYYERSYFAVGQPRLHVQPVPHRRLSRQDRPRQYAARAADRLVDRGRTRGVARLRDLRQSRAAQGRPALRQARRHARLATARHPRAGRAIEPERRRAECDSRASTSASIRKSWRRRPCPMPADYFALTRILLVPSMWEEPFGRVAAEAMINGIPPLVGNRGALPEVCGGDASEGGGGRVLPIPAWMRPESTDVPPASDVEPWFESRLRALGRRGTLSIDRGAREADCRRALQRSGLAPAPRRLLHVARARQETRFHRPRRRSVTCKSKRERATCVPMDESADRAGICDPRACGPAHADKTVKTPTSAQGTQKGGHDYLW